MSKAEIVTRQARADVVVRPTGIQSWVFLSPQFPVFVVIQAPGPPSILVPRPEAEAVVLGRTGRTSVETRPGQLEAIPCQ